MFAREVTAQTGPAGRERAKNLLWAAGRLADYGLGLGLEPVPEVLLHPSVAERFTRCAPGLSGVARRTLRTNLRFIGRRVVPQLYPADLPLPRGRAKAPYTAAEIAGFLALADAQPTRERRMRAAGLVCLGAGAGLIRGDLRDARGTDVACRCGGVIVTVRGARPRAVPVLARYHCRLLAAAQAAGTGLICGGSDPGRRNLTNPLVAALDGGTGLPRLDTSRLRATWLTDCAQRLGLHLALLRAPKDPAPDHAPPTGQNVRRKRENRAHSNVKTSCVVRGRVELPTFRFSGGRSYQLSYLTLTKARQGQMSAVLTGFEPATSTLTGWRALHAALQDHRYRRL